MIILAAANGNGESMQAQTDEYYEQRASQEQTYLDEVEARLIEGLTSVWAMRLTNDWS